MHNFLLSKTDIFINWVPHSTRGQSAGLYWIDKRELLFIIRINPNENPEVVPTSRYVYLAYYLDFLFISKRRVLIAMLLSFLFCFWQTIDEVYLDHLNTSKSGRPHCTFIVKTKRRSYHLQAASDAAARIWIDAIITGAQGNIDY